MTASSLSPKQIQTTIFSSSPSPSAVEANVPTFVMQKSPSNSVESPKHSRHFNFHRHEESSIHSIVYCRTSSNKVVHYSPCQDRTEISCPISDLKKGETPSSPGLHDAHDSTKQRTTALSWLSSLLSRRRWKLNGAETRPDHDVAVAMVHHDDGDDGLSWEPPRASSWEQLSSWEKPCLPSLCAEDQCYNSTFPSHLQHEADHGSNSNAETCTGSKHEGKKPWPVIRKFLFFNTLWTAGHKGHDNIKKKKKRRADAGAAVLSAPSGASPAPLPPSIARSERHHIYNNSYYSPAYYNSVYCSKPNTPRAGVMYSRPNTPRGATDHGLLRFYLAPNSFALRPRSKSQSRHRRTASVT